MVGTGAQCDPLTHEAGIPVALPHPASECLHPTPIEPGALPLLSRRKSRVASQEPSTPGELCIM